MNENQWIQVNPVVFNGRGYSTKEDHVFVIMPFAPRWSGKVWRTVKETMTELGFKVSRADEQYGHQILEDIWRGLCEASIVIADVTGRNPNVYYELGIAHVLGRRILLLTQEVGDLPFDIRVYRYIRYKVPWTPQRCKRELGNLSTEIRKTVNWMAEHETAPLDSPLRTMYERLRARPST